MKKSTIASLLILCGSTAALAQVATPPNEGGLVNNTTANTSVDQPADPAADAAPDNTTANSPTPM